MAEVKIATPLPLFRLVVDGKVSDIVIECPSKEEFDKAWNLETDVGHHVLTVLQHLLKVEATLACGERVVSIGPDDSVIRWKVLTNAELDE